MHSPQKSPVVVMGVVQRAVMSMVVIAGLGLAVASAQGQDVVRDVQNHWSVRVPAGWVPAPGGFLEGIQQEMARRAPEVSFRYVGALVPAGGDEGVFVLMQFTPGDLSRVSAVQMAEQMNATVLDRAVGHAAHGLKDIVSGMTPGRAVFEPQTGRYAMEVGTTSLDGRDSRTLVVGVAARHGLAQVNCSAPEARFEELRPVFEALGASITLDSGWVWDPSAPKGANAMPGWVRGALSGAAAGAFFGIIIAVSRKMRKAGPS
jgi:hypothetical protein